MPTSRPLILVVDADATFRRLLAAALQARGHAVAEAGSAAQGTELMERDNPALVLVDGGLPDGQGMAWVGHLRAYGNTVRVFFLADPEQLASWAPHLENLGIQDLWPKPVVLASLADALDEATAHMIASPLLPMARRHISATPRDVTLALDEEEPALAPPSPGRGQ